MTDLLLEQAFEKAGKASGKDSINGKAEYISEFILEELKFSVSAKSITRYYKKTSTPGRQIKNHLAQFLNYEDYEAFVLANARTEKMPLNAAKNKKYISKRSLLIFLLIIPLIGLSAYVGYINGEEECMVWKKDHYEKTTCTGSQLEQEFIPRLYENFRKIQVSDTTRFFKNGKAQVWYDKSNKQLEFFTAPGIHPENGKTLKPITTYMIKKHIRE